MAVRSLQLQWRGAQVQWQLLQSACSEVFLAGIGRHNRKSYALPCACHGQFSAFDAVAAANRYLDDVARSILKLPGLPLQRTEGDDAGQRLQSTHMAWHTCLGQQGCGGNHDAGQCGDFACDESAVLLVTSVEDDRKVEVFSKHFQSGHSGIAFELDPRMEATEFGDDGSKQPRRLARHAHPQRTTQFALYRTKFILRGEQSVEKGHGALVEQSAGFRHAQMSVMQLRVLQFDKRYPDGLLQLAVA